MTRKRRLSGEDGQLLLLAAPGLVWYLLFCYVPLFGILIAFKKFRPSGQGFWHSLFVQSPWCGLDNFEYLFKTPDAALMFRNTLAYNLVFIVLGAVLPVALAVMMSSLYSKKTARVCQTALFLPHFLSWVVVSYFVYAFLSTDKGLVNRALALHVPWYQTPSAWPYLLVFLQLWKTLGYQMVVYLASINGIDGAMYEAAVMDGASRWQQTRYVTLPALRSVVSVLFLLAVGRVFYSDFGLFYRVPRDSSALSDVTLTLDVYVYRSLMTSSRPQYNYASAASLVQSVLGCILLWAANAAVRRFDRESALF